MPLPKPSRGHPRLVALRARTALGGVAVLCGCLVSSCQKPSVPSTPPSQDAAAASTSDAAADALANAAADAAARIDAAPDVPVTVTLKPNDPCLTSCRKLVKELACGDGQGCYDACAKLRGAAHCAKEAQAFIACFVKQPRSRWGCSEHLPALDDSACKNEQAGMSACLMRNDGKL